MIVARIRLGLRNINDWDLLNKALSVLNGMKKDPRFRLSWVSMATFEASIEDFKQALNDRKSSGIYGTADKNAKRDVLINQYRKLANYVESIAKDDDHELITAAGFDTKRPTPGPAPLPKGVILKIENAGTGILLLRVKVIRNTAMYYMRFCLVADDGTPAEWSGPKGFPNSRIRVEGLIPGKVYAFQVWGTGAAGPGDWSDPVRHRSL